MNEEPLPIRGYLIAAALMAAMLIAPKTQTIEGEYHLPDTEYPPRIFWDGVDSPQAPSRTLGSIAEPTNPKLDGLGLSYSEKILLDKIIECESNWRNVCNQQYGCKAGAGVAQLIPSTTKYCSENLEKKIDPLNERDSLECAAWLLTRTPQAHFHWGKPDSWWGSYFCWHKAL